MTKAAIQKLHRDAEKAIKDAVEKALARHYAAGVPAVVWRNGKVVSLSGPQLKRKKTK